MNSVNHTVDGQQDNPTSNFVSTNYLIAQFIRYGVSSISAVCVNESDYLVTCSWHEKNKTFNS